MAVPATVARASSKRIPWISIVEDRPSGSFDSAPITRMQDAVSRRFAFAKVYLHGASAESAEASPFFGDLRGLPPVLIHVSSTELLFDDAVRLHEKAASCGVKSTLSVYPGLPHVWHILAGLIPEAGTALDEIADFISSAWRVSSLHPKADGDRGKNRTPKASAAPAYNQEDVTS